MTQSSTISLHLQTCSCHLRACSQLSQRLTPVPFYPFLGEGSPSKIDYRKKGTLILTSLREELGYIYHLSSLPLSSSFSCAPTRLADLQFLALFSSCRHGRVRSQRRVESSRQKMHPWPGQHLGEPGVGLSSRELAQMQAGLSSS